MPESDTIKDEAMLQEEDEAVLRYREQQEEAKLAKLGQKPGATVSDDTVAELFWSKEMERQGKDGWYLKALQYWDAQEASVNGVLGGYGHTTGQDLRESGRLLKLLKGRKDLNLSFKSCLDCGAGIGRISEGLLLNEFENVDILEPCGKLIVEARRRLANGRGIAILNSVKSKRGIRNFYPFSLQDFSFCSQKNRLLGADETAKEVDDRLRQWQSENYNNRHSSTVTSSSNTTTTVTDSDISDQSPTEEIQSSSNIKSQSGSGTNLVSVAAQAQKSAIEFREKAKLNRQAMISAPQTGSEVIIEPIKYDCIWNQWVLLYLTDDDLVAYLRRCRKALNPNGFIFAKENCMLPAKTQSDKDSYRYKRGFEIDADDNGITRTDDRYRMLFYKAGLDIVCAMRQANWPSDLYPVYMYVLTPNKGVEALEKQQNCL